MRNVDKAALSFGAYDLSAVLTPPADVGPDDSNICHLSRYREKSRLQRSPLNFFVTEVNHTAWRELYVSSVIPNDGCEAISHFPSDLRSNSFVISYAHYAVCSVSQCCGIFLPLDDPWNESLLPICKHVVTLLTTTVRASEEWKKWRVACAGVSV